MFLESHRLNIRTVMDKDFDDYFSYIMDPELQRMLGLNDVTDRASARETFDWLMNNRTFLALEKKETGKVIGHICLHPPYPALENDPEFIGKTGFSLSFAAAGGERRKGYMEEALRSLIRDLFEKGRADFIDCEYTAFNTASRALQKKLGFTYWGAEPLEYTELIINVLKK